MERMSNMKIKEQGVLASSDVYFYTPSEMARRLFFYLLCTGRYKCDGSYRVERQSYDSFLLLYVVKGNGFLLRNGEKCLLSEGALALIDCYQPHQYGTKDGWEILWCHFDGVLSREYFQQIEKNSSAVQAQCDQYNVMRPMERIFSMFHLEHAANEAWMSHAISTVLTAMLSQPIERADKASALDDVTNHISRHFDEPLTVEKLAKQAMMSLFYFTRVFKKETGYTPHEYLLLVRVNAAKYYLRSSAMQSKEIAWRCGFGSEGGFCKAFRRVTGTTPLSYRLEKDPAMPLPPLS